MHITFKDMHEKDHFLKSMLSLLKNFNAHTIEHIQINDSINIKHGHNQRHIIIELC